METPAKNTEIDFRFAGAEDTAEILSLVNNAFSVEKGDSDLAFTTRDRIKKEEVDACLHGAGGKKRWLVLETPHPEEKMVAACLICTGSTPGKGSVDVLAVEPARQREGLGSDMLRRAEGILLNFRCRFVKMRVPQWREDVLGWAAKQGYKETGGGVWGELDGENAEDVTRPTRYFVLTRDLLKDEKVVGTFGDGTTRFAAATAAAAKRTAAANDIKAASNPASSAAPWRAEGEPAKVRRAKEESGRLAGFLSTVLKGLVDAEDKEQNADGSSEGGKSRAAAPMADMAVGTSATPSSSEVLLPPLPPAIGNRSSVSPGVARELGSTTASGSTASVAASSSVSASIDELEVVEVQSVGGDVGTDSAGGGEEEESVEDLLSSLMRTLNTEQGRADFRLLASGATP